MMQYKLSKRICFVFNGINMTAIVITVFIGNILRSPYSPEDRISRQKGLILWNKDTHYIDKNTNIADINQTSTEQLFSPTHLQIDVLQGDTEKKHAKVIERRLNRVKRQCTKYFKEAPGKGFTSTIVSFIYSIPKEVNFCEVPKAACTFWKSVLRFLTGDYPKHWKVEKPYDLNRKFVHNGKWQIIKRHRYPKNDLKFKTFSEGTNFMFVREPYGRLWSAYLDKFYLPDFWQRLGPIFRHGNDARCIANISFEEFLNQIAQQSDNRFRNIHWEPFYRLCNPCFMNYDVIGKIETFTDDSKFILNHLTRGRLINMSKTDTDSKAMAEIVMLTDYNFSFKNNSCFNHKLIANRLWSVFQMNGYIHKKFKFPLQMFQHNISYSTNKNISSFFKTLVFEALIRQKRLGLDSKYQKRIYMLEGYKSIPLTILYKIKEIYQYDFELFGYNSAPAEIFSR